MNYLKYILKLLSGAMIIVALDVILRKADPYLGNEWIYTTLILYNGYCYLDFRLNDKTNDK